MTQPEAIPALGGIHRLKRYYENNERKVDIAAFAGGFVFDIVTLDRTDSWLVIGQQVLYLTVITTVLLQMFFEEGKHRPISTECSPSNAGSTSTARRSSISFSARC